MTAKLHLISCVNVSAPLPFWHSPTSVASSSWILMLVMWELEQSSHKRTMRGVRELWLMAVEPFLGLRDNTVSQDGNFWQWWNSHDSITPILLDASLFFVLTMALSHGYGTSGTLRDRSHVG